MVNENEVKGIRRLFQACLIRILKDAFTNLTTYKEDRKIYHPNRFLNYQDILDARRFLTEDRYYKDFLEVCNMAEVPSNKIRKFCIENLAKSESEINKIGRKLKVIYPWSK